MSVLKSHLTRYYLRINVRIWLEITISTLDHDLVISLGQMTYLSSLNRSSIGSLITDLVTFRSSCDLDTNDLIDTQSASTSSCPFQVIPMSWTAQKLPHVLWSLSVIARLYDSLELTTYPPFNAHNDGDLGCIVLEKGADVEEM